MPAPLVVRREAVGLACDSVGIGGVSRNPRKFREVLTDTKQAASDARAAAKKAGEEAAELRGQLAGKAEQKPQQVKKSPGKPAT